MYIATLDGTEKEDIVKFTVRYNEKAHILADAGFAPKLHFCGRVVGGLYTVVMDAKSLWQLQTDKMPRIGCYKREFAYLVLKAGRKSSLQHLGFSLEIPLSPSLRPST